MKNSYGQSISVSLFGESHGPAVGVLIDGLAPGIPVRDEDIEKQLSRRRPGTSLDTARREQDHYQILSGVFGGFTTGTPLCIVIPNEDANSKEYSYGVARPSHADYSAFVKYHGFEDYRGGGHFSGRVTTGITAAGGILIPALEKLGITIGTHILRCGQAEDRPFENVEADVAALSAGSFPALDPGAEQRIADQILEARSRNDSIGGITQTAVCGLMPGLGEPWFDSIESLLSHALYSLGGIKGVEFGKGFGFAEGTGSTCNDGFRMQGSRVITTTNFNGGINGGISNGMPVVFQCAVKPTPSIARRQDSVNFLQGTDADILIAGRHDPAIVKRVCPVIDSICAIVIADMLACRYGTDFLAGGYKK